MWRTNRPNRNFESGELEALSKLWQQATAGGVFFPGAGGAPNIRIDLIRLEEYDVPPIGVSTPNAPIRRWKIFRLDDHSGSQSSGSSAASSEGSLPLVRSSSAAAAAPTDVDATEILPTEIWVQILSLISLRDRFALAQCCRSLHSIVWATTVLSEDDQPASPLWMAARHGFHHVVTMFLDEDGADPNLARSSGSTPLGTASFYGHQLVVEAFLSRRAAYGINLDACTRRSGSTALSSAAANGHASCVRLLCAAGASVDMRLHNGTTPLFLACKNGHADVVAELLKWRVDLTLDDHGTSPMFVAVENKHEDVALLLLGAGTDPNHVHSRSGRPLLVEAADGGCLRTVNALLSRGAQPDARDYSGNTALTIACSTGDAALLQALLDSNCSLAAPVEGEYSPLMITAANGHLALVQKLMDAGAKVDYEAASHDTAVKAAMRHRHDQVVAWLVHGPELKQLRAQQDERYALAVRRAATLAKELTEAEAEVRRLRARLNNVGETPTSTARRGL